MNKEFFENLGRKITEVADDFGRKAEETYDVQKIKSQIRSLKRENEKDFADIGRMVYEKFQRNEIEDVMYVNLCSNIEKRDEKINEKEEEIENRMTR